MLDLRQRDKQQHLLAGIIITVMLYPLVGFFAVLDAIIIGLLKEFVVDVFWSKGNPDIWDALATALGAIVAGLAIALIEFAI
jgi:hypothetical protein